MKLEVSQETEDEDRGTSAAEEIQEEKAHTFSQRSWRGGCRGLRVTCPQGSRTARQTRAPEAHHCRGAGVPSVNPVGHRLLGAVSVTSTAQPGPEQWESRVCGE